ncbi:MAG: rane protein of unknown function [Pseudonocardiales bacterium]|nr:rane protein of unknown function [Jatrophihabitantaceae bacterium]MCW2602523.1 rane protein of unknown function [Pseudonocardiales bacterium]
MSQPLALDYETGLNDAWSNVATFVPKLVVFLLILIIGYFIAKIVSKILTKALQRVGFDRMVERGGIKKALEGSQYDAAAILAKVVFYAIMLFVLSTAFGVFGPNPISDYLKAIVSYLPLVFVAIVIVVIASAIAAAAKALIENSLGGLSYAKVLANAASAVILALGVIAALDQLNIAENVVNAVLYAALAAIVGVVIVAVGGGGIRTMSTRWEAVAAKYDEEKPRIADAARNSPSVKQQAQQAKQHADSSARSGASANGRTSR